MDFKTYLSEEKELDLDKLIGYFKGKYKGHYKGIKTDPDYKKLSDADKDYVLGQLQENLNSEEE